MANPLREKERALIVERWERDPSAFERRELIFWLLVSMVATRLLYAISFTLYLTIRGIYVPTFEYIMMFFMVIVALVFGAILYSGGVMAAAYLALGGGAYSLFMAYNEGVFPPPITEDAFFNVVGILLTLSILVQMGTMLFVVLDKKCKIYLKTMNEIRKEVVVWARSQQR